MLLSLTTIAGRIHVKRIFLLIKAFRVYCLFSSSWYVDRSVDHSMNVKTTCGIGLRQLTTRPFLRIIGITSASIIYYFFCPQPFLPSAHPALSPSSQLIPPSSHTICPSNPYALQNILPFVALHRLLFALPRLSLLFIAPHLPFIALRDALHRLQVALHHQSLPIICCQFPAIYYKSAIISPMHHQDAIFDLQSSISCYSISWSFYYSVGWLVNPWLQDLECAWILLSWFLLPGCTLFVWSCISVYPW